jgi:nitroimidazol reductase NimA-like FMN-containing flavoprotein (pyridoxamine 5'-phosphate oxidase superfamily)
MTRSPGCKLAHEPTAIYNRLPQDRQPEQEAQMAEVKTQSKFVDKPRIEALLKTQRDGVLCYTDGTAPYGVPLKYTVYEDDALYFGLALGGRKGEYYEKCKKVCYVSYHLHESDGGANRQGWWSIILDGELSQVTDPAEIQRLGDAMEQAGMFSPGLKDKFLGAILANPAQSNFFKMSITNWGGKELGEYRPEKEIE